ncbi:hypothetical protein, partial [Parafannyhessea umbonata]|uniref:hypothetical protein n=1 Tax=Parafannyhessea umbonata TaxID=604330 RepID=UPI00359C766A
RMWSPSTKGFHKQWLIRVEDGQPVHIASRIDTGGNATASGHCGNQPHLCKRLSKDGGHLPAC